MEINGLPVHALVVHAAVVLVPLAVGAAVALALLPGWRWLTRWAAVLSAFAALGTVLVARLSGQDLVEDRPFLTSAQSQVRDLIHTHEERAEVLFWLTVAFVVVVVAAFILLPAPTGLASGRLDHPGNDAAWARLLLPALLVVLGGVVVVWVVLTGDAGAQAVWKI